MGRGRRINLACWICGRAFVRVPQGHPFEHDGGGGGVRGVPAQHLLEQRRALVHAVPCRHDDECNWERFGERLPMP